MFDVDGTLVLSDDFDGRCYFEAVREVLGHDLDTDWTRYSHVSDAGILEHIVQWNEGPVSPVGLRSAVKEVFVEKVATHLQNNPVQQVPGASAFISRLREFEDLSMSIATGGWRETALMKLESAGIDVSGIPVASSNDHFSRTRIMTIARQRAGGDDESACTYFGDGEWDRRACEDLGYNFVLVGANASHHQRIKDFSNTKQALAYLGLQ